MTLRNISAALLAAALLAGPAFAQTPKPSAPAAPPAGAISSPNDLTEAQMDELYCIYDVMGLDNDALAVADAVRGDVTKTAVAKQVYEKARTACIAKFTWSEDQAGVASMLASSAVTTDVVESGLIGKGYDDKKFETVLAVVDKVSAEDMDKFLYDGGKIDPAVLTRIRTALTDAGVAQETLELSLAFLQSSLQEYDAVMQWVDAKFY